MTIDWTHELVEQLEWHWLEQLRPRLEGLGDDEYLWEPVPGCWNLRPRAEATTPMAAGAGGTVADFALPEPVPAPLTTIAWRMGHVSVGILGTRAASHFGHAPMSYFGTDWPLTASGGLALLDATYEAWMGGVRSLDAEGLARPCGPAEGEWSDRSFATLVLHINREVIHHGAEMALLRDLYQHRDDLGAGGAR
ncbi:MAG: DinB family protein [Actinomycetota bacterium]|nr:DinB family protein [Actinomycetota bacterium]